MVRLRQDLRWHDGTPFSADDVAYTMSLLSDPAYAGISAFGEFFATVETQKLNDHLLRFRLAQPQSSFPYLLTIGILPEHALRGTTMAQLARHPFNLSPIGTGPYQLAQLRLGAGNTVSALELARAPVYLERPESPGRYALDRLSFNLYPDSESALNAYTAGAVNALANVAPRARLLNLPNVRVYTQVAPASPCSSSIGMTRASPNGAFVRPSRSAWICQSWSISISALMSPTPIVPIRPALQFTCPMPFGTAKTWSRRARSWARPASSPPAPAKKTLSLTRMTMTPPRRSKPAH